MYTAIGGFIKRSSGFISALAFWAVGSSFGYVSGDEPGSNPDAAFRVLISIVPVILLGISFVISLFMKDLPETFAPNQEPAREEEARQPSIVG